jgi:putative transposase
MSDTAKEIQFIAGNALGTQVDALSNENYSETLSSINSVIDNYLAGSSVLKGLSGNMTTVLSGGKLVFPELWSDSDCSRSYDIDLKLRSPDCDSVSVYMNIIVPFIHLLAMTAPRQMSANGYSAPFLVRAFYKGCFNEERFLNFIKECVLDKYKNKLLLFDNAKAHTTNKIFSEIKKNNDYVLNVAYTPKFNPIESYFSQLKHYLKLDSEIEFDKLKISLKNAFKKITKTNYRNYFYNSLNTTQLPIRKSINHINTHKYKE